MVFESPLHRGLTSIPCDPLEPTKTKRRASPAAPGSLRPLDPVLLNGVRLNPAHSTQL